jgi:hypothetical protein
VDLAPSAEDEGRFAFELLRPGRYRPRTAADELYFATTLEVAPGATVDLGRIVLRCSTGASSAASGLYQPIR